MAENDQHGLDSRPAAPPPAEDAEERESRFVGDTYDAVKRWIWRIETWSVVLIAMATVATAWGAYQATRWSGVQAVDFVQASTSRSESIRAENIASTNEAIIIGLFTEWLAAKAADQPRLAGFYESRFPEEFQPAFEAWLQQPAVDGIPEGTPFSMPEYVLPKRVEAAALEQQAADYFEDGKEANQNGDNYILVSVLFATVLFFAGVSTRFERLRPKVILLSLGSIVFVAALVVEISLPRSIGF